MNDIEWLDRVWRAYRVYQDRVHIIDQSLDHFLFWLYKEYGVVPPPQRKK